MVDHGSTVHSALSLLVETCVEVTLRTRVFQIKDQGQDPRHLPYRLSEGCCSPLNGNGHCFSWSHAPAAGDVREIQVAEMMIGSDRSVLLELPLRPVDVPGSHPRELAREEPRALGGNTLESSARVSVEVRDTVEYRPSG